VRLTRSLDEPPRQYTWRTTAGTRRADKLTAQQAGDQRSIQ
jgi:hypothetical protein